MHGPHSETCMVHQISRALTGHVKAQQQANSKTAGGENISSCSKQGKERIPCVAESCRSLALAKATVAVRSLVGPECSAGDGCSLLKSSCGAAQRRRLDHDVVWPVKHSNLAAGQRRKELQNALSQQRLQR